MSAAAKGPPTLPIELWRCILRWCTSESAPDLPPRSAVPFGWPYNLTLGAPFFRSLATKRTLVLVSHHFSELASEFFYETLHFRRAEQAILLAEQCKSNPRLTGCLRSWTRTLIITPVFSTVTTEEELDEMVDFLRSMLEIARKCSHLRTASVQVDSVTLFQDPTYQSWVEILGALSPELQHLAVEDFLLGPVIWKPRLFSTWNNLGGSNLRTLRLDAEHPPFEYHFPHLTHLWLFSWSTASLWDMPSLTNLYIEYFPGNESTKSFWLEPKPQLRLLHFGRDTDFGLYFPDLPQRLRDCTPNLQELEYHYAGDLDILWDPSQLSSSIKRITIRLEDGEGRGGVGYPLTSRDVLLRYTAAGFGILLELLTEPCPSGSHRRLRIERHLEIYCAHGAKLFVLLPRHAVGLLQLDNPPPIIRTSRVPMFPER